MQQQLLAGKLQCCCKGLWAAVHAVARARCCGLLCWFSKGTNDEDVLEQRVVEKEGVPYYEWCVLLTL